MENRSGNDVFPFVNFTDGIGFLILGLIIGPDINIGYYAYRDQLNTSQQKDQPENQQWLPPILFPISFSPSR